MPSDAPAERFRTTIDLWATGVMLQGQRLRRLHPLVSDAEIERLINRWLSDRPGAEAGGHAPARA